MTKARRTGPIYGSSKHVLPKQVHYIYYSRTLTLASSTSQLAVATIAKAAAQGFFFISYVRGSEHWSVDYACDHQRLRHIFIRWNFISVRIRSSSLSTFLTSRITQFNSGASHLALATLVAGAFLLRQDLAHSDLEFILFLHQLVQRFLQHVHISLDLLQKSIAFNGLVSQRLQSHADKWWGQIHNKRSKVTNDLA